ncbi:MAG: hypothetical protein H0X37_19920 [Herpetosiphonaceae bacterium]|nr:hypothetical protein [Herpetosiphonaceae bacterium]
MNPIALVLLEAEITDEVVSRARQACAANGQLEPTEPAHFRVFLTTLVADLQARAERGPQLQRLQRYNLYLTQLGVGLIDPAYNWPARTASYRTPVA